MPSYNVPMAHCYFCGQETVRGERIYRTSMCSACGKPLKICRNCEFYDPGAKYECREHIQDPVRDKEQENFCEYFSPDLSPWSPDDGSVKKQARDRFNSLFNL